MRAWADAGATWDNRKREEVKQNAIAAQSRLSAVYPFFYTILLITVAPTGGIIWE